MYVCICNAVTEGEIREAYGQGACTFEAQQGELGVSTCCGCCEPAVREILGACRAGEDVHASVGRVPAMPGVPLPSAG